MRFLPSAFCFSSRRTLGTIRTEVNRTQRLQDGEVLQMTKRALKVIRPGTLCFLDCRFDINSNDRQVTLCPQGNCEANWSVPFLKGKATVQIGKFSVTSSCSNSCFCKLYLLSEVLKKILHTFWCFQEAKISRKKSAKAKIMFKTSNLWNENAPGIVSRVELHPYSKSKIQFLKVNNSNL